MYKPMVKSSGGQRESEGAVVPLIGVQHNALGGKDPHFDHVRGAGKREGMAGERPANYPGGDVPAVVDGRASVLKVRQLQRVLWTAANLGSTVQRGFVGSGQESALVSALRLVARAGNA